MWNFRRIQHCSYARVCENRSLDRIFQQLDEKAATENTF